VIVEPRPEFVSLPETAILKALDDPSPNAIASEVGRLVEGYTINFRAHVERIGRMPDSILRAKPASAIEAVAIRLASEEIRRARE
jgi:hypothetical protein